MNKPKPRRKLTFHPLTPARWPDLVQLFGPEGAVGGCWCMWWRESPKVFAQNVGDNNQRVFQKMVEVGKPVGVLAYAGAQPIGWCSVSPRAQLIRVRTSATWRPIDSETVWAIGCYFVHADYRNQGVATRLLQAAVKYAKRQGAEVIEAYPKDIGPLPTKVKDEALYFGTVAMYQAAGFVEVARRHVAFPIMRLRVARER